MPNLTEMQFPRWRWLRISSLSQGRKFWDFASLKTRWPSGGDANTTPNIPWIGRVFRTVLPNGRHVTTLNNVESMSFGHSNHLLCLTTISLNASLKSLTTGLFTGGWLVPKMADEVQLVFTCLLCLEERNIISERNDCLFAKRTNKRCCTHHAFTM